MALAAARGSTGPTHATAPGRRWLRSL